MTSPTFAFGPGVADALEQLDAIAAEFPLTDPPGARMFARSRNRLAGPVPELPEVRNATIPRRLGGIGLRLYRPAPGRLPVVLFIHGGWFYYGDLESHDTFCRSLAEAAGCVVVALHYRRGPEYPCPAAADDCFEVVQWIVENAANLDVDLAGFALVGDGAGGALAAITARRARDAGGPAICHQVLLYPVISRDRDTSSWRELAGAPIVDAKQVGVAWSWYVPPGCEAVPADIVPEACEDLFGLPSALVITAEFDPLRDEGEAYAARLQAAGIPAAVRRYPGMVHGFAGLAGLIPAGRDAIAEVAASLRAAFAASTS